MSIEVRVGGEVPEKKVFRLPASCERDKERGGVLKANVDVYWRPEVEDGEPRASFRGRGLRGGSVALPSGYGGYVLDETKRPLTENADRKTFVSGRFERFEYWNWDKRPTADDPVPRALEWIAVAEALHET